MIQIRYILIFILIVPAQIAWGQFEYFDNLYGVSGDTDAEIITNIELINEHYYAWGGGIQSSVNVKNFSRFSELGFEEFQNSLEFSDILYIGTTNSFLAMNDGLSLMTSNGLQTDTNVVAVLIKVDLNLDTIWMKRFDFYEPHTYFYALNHDGDDIILCGEYGASSGEKGTFLAKVDTDGNLLWQNSLHEPSEGVYRALEVSKVVNGYLVSGVHGLNPNPVGYIDFIDLNGDLDWSLDAPVAEILGSGIRQFKDLNDSPVLVQTVVYDAWPSSPSPVLGYGKIRYMSVDFNNPSLNILGEVMIDQEMVLPSGAKTVLAFDGSGYVTAGKYYKPVGNALHQQSYILKVNTNFELEWYTELAYDPCASCENTIYDMVRAPDGGYTMAGEFRNNDSDPFPRSWLVKVDACGDMEWQGCEPVGLEETGSSTSLGVLDLELYPNPAADHVRVVLHSDRTLSEAEGPYQLQVLDITGKVVKELSNTSTALSTGSEVTIDISNLPSGLYSIVLRTEEGEIYSGKVVKD